MHTHETLEHIAATNAWARYGVLDRALLAFTLLAAGLLLPTWPWKLAVLGLTTAFALLWARVPAGTWARGMLAVAGVTALTAVPLLWMGGAATQALGAAGRTLSAGAAMLLLASTTPAEELLASAQRRTVLRPFAELALLVLRFLTVLRECAASVSTAWHCRAGARSRPRFRFSLQAAASIVVRGLHRAQRMETGMNLRARGEHLRFWAPVRQAGWRLRFASAAIAVVVSGVAILLRETFPWR